MNRRNQFFLLTVVALMIVVVGMFTYRHMVEGIRQAATLLTYNVGRELVDTTNSSFLIGDSPELHANLSRLMVSPTHIANVRLGDEPSPVGDGTASSRLMLTNELAQGLGIRLRMRSAPKGQSRFEVLGYWTISNTTDHACCN